jgi:uncharacterized protein DUF6438
VIRSSEATLLLFLLACAPRKTVTPPVEGSAQTGVDGAAITLERTACFGSCPVYRVSVFPSGQVTYEGKAHVRRVGSASGQIPQLQLDALLEEIDRSGYFTFAPRYTTGQPACGRYATDAPSVITSVTLRGRTHRVEHDYGCGSAPGALVILEQRIDEVAGSAQWTGK